MRIVNLHGTTQSGAFRQLPAIDGQSIDRKAEIHFISDIINNCWSQLATYTKIEYAKHGYDIEIQSPTKTITIELKASSYKADYFNQNGVCTYLHGNCLKPKDIDLKTGLLKADFLLFAAEIPPGFDFWLFSRDELSSLFPRSPTYIPSFIPTLMIEAPNRGLGFGSHFNDDFNLFKKGAMCIILPIYDPKSSTWTSTYPMGTYHDFLNTWCPLFDAEYIEMAKVMTAKLANRFNRSLLFTHTNTVHKNSNYCPRHCSYRIQTCNPKCTRCQQIIGSMTPL